MWMGFIYVGFILALRQKNRLLDKSLSSSLQVVRIEYELLHDKIECKDWIGVIT